MLQRLRLLSFVLVCIAAPMVAADDPVRTPLQRHMQHMHNAGDQWRTANPDFDPAQGGPIEYGLRFVLAPDGSHVTGNLTGIFEDGREALYWSLLSLYNPVTEKVITKQIGWDGTLLHGDVPLQEGRLQIIDMLQYGADGSVSISRHENRYQSNGEHSSVVLEPDGKGGWAEKQSWTWRRQAAGDFNPEPSGTPGAIAEHAGFLLAGSGRWRAPNPDYTTGSEDEQFYGMNYRWGPHRQHVVGEIVSIYADGREAMDWSLFMTWNPVTGQAVLEQTGANGVYFRGELGKTKDGRHKQQGLIYLPNGEVKSVRDEIEVLDSRRYRSHVFERDQNGGWKKVRVWTWTRQAAG